MIEHSIQVENVFIRLLHDVTRLNVPEQDVRSIGNKNINVLKVLHTHPYYEIFFSTGQTVVISSAAETVSIDRGDVVIVPPGVEHVMLSEKNGDGWPSLCFSFSRKSGGTQDLFSDFRNFLERNGLIVIRNRPEESRRISEITEAAVNDRSKYLASSIADVIIRLTGLQSGEPGTAAAPSPQKRADEDIDVLVSRQIEDLIAATFTTDITTGEAAKRLHMSVRQLNRIMKKYNGMSFHRAVSLRRLRVAIELFETTDLTIERISSDVGFPSRVAFTRAFTSRYGIPPGKYRRLYCSKAVG
ncbi:MAG: helix-turn-helix transcriptional regulator [Clostridia bacterium]|nr:helix-turn-helix transcriptional regulator [Clostridia bacterium]MBR5767746.1 helix-turn-helix transcriptional regulator [Clostridia bacterium]